MEPTPRIRALLNYCSDTALPRSNPAGPLPSTRRATVPRAALPTSAHPDVPRAKAVGTESLSEMHCESVFRSAAKDPRPPFDRRTGVDLARVEGALGFEFIEFAPRICSSLFIRICCKNLFQFVHSNLFQDVLCSGGFQYKSHSRSKEYSFSLLLNCSRLLLHSSTIVML